MQVAKLDPRFVFELLDEVAVPAQALAEGGEFGTVTVLSLRRMEIELFIALLVVVLAGQPAALKDRDNEPSVSGIGIEFARAQQAGISQVWIFSEQIR